MSDLRIEIEVPPTQAVAGSKAIKAAVDETERAGKKASLTYEEFGRDLARTRQEMDRLTASSKAAAASQAANSYAKKGPSFNDKANSFVGGFTGGMGAAGAIAGAAMAVDQGLKAFDDYQIKLDNAQNSLVRFFGTQEQAAARLPQFQQLQHNLNASLDETVAAFDAVEGATKTLGLSTEQQIAITRNLSQAMIVDGKAIGDVSGVIERLEFAIDKGSISGGELAKIMKAFPPLAEQWRSEFGMTNAELLKAADSGKLVKMGLDRLITTYTNTGAASKQYEERVITRTDLERQAGSDSVPALTMAYIHHKEAMEAAKDEAASLSFNLENQVTTLTKLHAKLSEGFGLWKTTKELVDLVATSVDRAGTSIVNFVNDPWSSTFEDSIAKIKKGMDDWRTSVEAAKKAGAEFADARRQWAQDALASEIQARNAPRPVGVTNGSWPGSNFADVDVGAATQSNTEQQLQSAWDDLSSLNDEWSTGVDAIKSYDQAMADLNNGPMTALQGAAQLLGSTLVDAFMSGKFSAETFFDTLTRQLANQAIAGLISELFKKRESSPQSVGEAVIAGLGLGGGATGFDSMVGGGRGAFLPGFASGGDMLVGGAGGTDSRIAAFRVTPGESIHVRTPQQRDASMASSRGGNVKIVNQSQSMRSLLQDFDGDGEFDRVVLNVIQRHGGSVAALLPR